MYATFDATNYLKNNEYTRISNRISINIPEVLMAAAVVLSGGQAILYFELGGVMP